MNDDRLNFRVWSIEEKKYHYFNLFGLDECYLYSDGYVIKEDDIIEQCTGLKDKNGNLIYEGDIITRNGMYRKVFWIDDEGGFGYEPSTLFEPLQTETCEVIGNIHENHELLDKVK